MVIGGLLKVFSGKSATSRAKSGGGEPWEVPPYDLVDGMREFMREDAMYNQAAVDHAEISYLQAMEDGASDERVSVLLEEFEHRRVRNRGVCSLDGFWVVCAL